MATTLVTPRGTLRFEENPESWAWNDTPISRADAQQIAQGIARANRIAVARDAYLRGDTDVALFERVLDVELGLAEGEVAWVGVDGPEWIIRPGEGA